MSTEQKIRFIEAVMNGELDVRNRRMDDVIADIERLGLPGELLWTIKIMDLTETRLAQLRGETVAKG